ncbi:SDR family NAD(P)-dependent oxidoreductase, partial [Streptomyces clavuligerus]
TGAETGAGGVPLPYLSPRAPGEATALLHCRTGERTSYARLTALVDRAARALADRGIGPGQTVALLLGNGVPFAAAYHGALRAGATVLPLDPLAPPAEWERLIRTAHARSLVTTRDAWDALRPLPGARALRHTLLTDTGAGLEEPDTGPEPEPGDGPGPELGPEPETEPEPEPEPGPESTPQGVPEHFPIPDPTATAVLLSSSGTSGPPKLIRLTHGNLSVNLAQIHARQRLTPDDVIVAAAPWRHIFGMQMALNHSLRSGATLAFTGARFSLEELLHAVERHRITVAFLAPPTVRLLAQDPAVDRYDLSSLRIILSGGAPLAPEIADACARRTGAVVRQGFGMTELGCAFLVPDGAEDPPPGSVGLPLPGTDVRISDPETGAELPPGTEGELWLRGPQISPGPAGDGTAPAPALTDGEGWLHTGDLARVDARGYCFVTGRLKELIKYKGHSVAPAESEAVLLTHPAVADAAVVGVPDPDCGELPKAYVVLRPESGIPRPLPDPPPGSPLPSPLASLLDSLLAHVAERVPPQRRIRAIETVRELPRNATGKLLRRELTARAAATARGALHGRTALVTGASRGLGLLFAEALAAAGADVVITGRDGRTLAGAAERVARAAPDDRTRVRAIPMDVRDPAAVRRAVEEATGALGPIGVLVNNAGVTGPRGPLWEVGGEEWWDAQETNVRGVVNACRAVVPGMIAAGAGARIVNVVSVAGQQGWAHASAYSVSKSAGIRLTECLAAELEPHGIAAFSFHPGLVDSGMTADHLRRHPTGDHWEDLIGEWLHTAYENGRFTPAEDAARALVRLVSGPADALSGRYVTTESVLADPPRRADGGG